MLRQRFKALRRGQHGRVDSAIATNSPDQRACRQHRRARSNTRRVEPTTTTPAPAMTKTTAAVASDGTPQPRSPATSQRQISPPKRPKWAGAQDLSTGLHRPTRLSHKVVPSRARDAAAATSPVDNHICPAHRCHDHPVALATSQARVPETAIHTPPVIPRRSTHQRIKRPESPSIADSICQRQDGTVSCQRYPH